MVKIWIYFTCEILVLAQATEGLNVTLCEDSVQKFAKVSCPENKTISRKSIMYGEFPCQDANNRVICYSNINTFFNDNCLGKNNCTLPIDLLSNNSCQRSPKRVKVYFECSRGWWWKNRHPDPVKTCANSLADVHCSSKYHIHFKNAMIYHTTSSCDEIKTDCAKDRLEYFCNEKRMCISDKTNNSCLYHKRFASIHFACIDRSLKTTTIIATRNLTSENVEKYDFSLDDDHRVVIHQNSHNQTYHLCSHGWDDNDAAVFCNNLNGTWIGNSTVVNKLFDIPIAPYSLHCDGLEVSLFECNYTEDATSCNTTKVAGAVCCQGTDKLGKCVTNILPQKVSSEKSGSSTLGIAVGIPVAIIVVVCVIVVIAFIRRRYVSKDSNRKFSNFMSQNTDDDYIGQQNIALPQYPPNKKVPNSQVTDNITNTTKKEDGQDYSYPCKDTQSPYGLSEEGVYDKTNERRHVVNDADEYSRAVDTVYDSAEQNTKQDRKEETYDHVVGQKTEDFYDKITRT
ncbi:unnamed protein product [Mytilus coruscus]|uniref:SRCR domain-containing protein n=1 Tax=Mytilus coruscus TaxID=42192 RepID=A0A6J8DR48_MYTCO|nr:unnamed protein product [Mytilus coruscus]